MNRNQTVVRVLFGLGIVTVGALILAYGYSTLLFLPPPPTWIPWLTVVGYASGVLLVATGAGLWFERTARVSILILMPFLLLWTLTRVPVAIMDPGSEISWFAIGEIGVLAAGAMVLYTWLAQPKSASTFMLIARLLYGPSLVTYGLAHFFEFAARTVSLVPAWMPFRTFWADLTGAGQIAAGLGVLFLVLPRLAAASEAAMMSIFTLLIWIPAVITKPDLASNWGEFLFTFAIAGASWVMAVGLP
jgi:uncharacterized membrane protein YphA (DoxX/SURF4 family)